MSTKPLKKGATYDDLRRVEAHFVAEMFDGDLYASPRPALPLDRGKKLHVYAREGVAHAWLVDPLVRTLEVLSLEAGGWRPRGSYEGGGVVRVEPFAAIAIELSALWN